MPEEVAVSAPPPDERITVKTMKQLKRCRRAGRRGKDGRTKSLAWRKSVFPDDEAFSLVSGEEGGFLSLEEIDESEYRLIGELPEPRADAKISTSNQSKTGKSDEEDDSGFEKVGESKKLTEKKPRKKKAKKKNVEENHDFAETNFEEVSEAKNLEEPSFRNDEYRAWKKMKLHPLLMKSLRSLGFKNPTPIQESCIPVVAHQGKDVIGAAETGSGKTLAFGLPILNCLLKERDKSIKLSNGGLRALILAPTRELSLQVCDHLKKVAKLTSIKVVPIVGGISSEKQERLLKSRPEIIVGTPGRLWELMSNGEHHLVELKTLSFFVLDEADRMIENGHFNELQSIIDMLPSNSESSETKRQTLVFSATIALSNNFRKKLKRGSLRSKSMGFSENISSLERLSERAGIRTDAEIVDLTNASILANKLEESFIECNDNNKEAYLYYLLSVHGHGRTIVFCTSIAALRRISSLLRILGIQMWTLHAQMQQRARLKAIDRFRETDDGVLVATDVAARGLDIPGVRTVIHFQLPHSADIYIHRSGRTARASADGCSIALISPPDRTKFFTLCKSLSKESLRKFPLVDSYMLEVTRRVSLARHIDKLARSSSRESVSKSWVQRNAEAVELMIDESGSEEERMKNKSKRKVNDAYLQKLQEELSVHLAKPLEPRTLSHRFLAGTGLSPLIQEQLLDFSKKGREVKNSKGDVRSRFVVIGQDCVEPLEALRTSGQEICVDSGKWKEMRKLTEDWKRKKRDEKKREREQRRKKKRKFEQNK